MNKQRTVSVVSIVLVCALLFGAYALLRNPRSSTNEPVIPIPERSASTTVPFVTYTDPAVGVSFSIPKDWERSTEATVRVESPDFTEEPLPDSTGKRVAVGAAISLEKDAYLVDSSEEYALLIEEIHESPECGNCLTGYPITIGDVPAYLGFASIDASNEPHGAIVSFVRGGNRYRLLMSFASYTPLNQEILAEAISTFVFTP